MRLDSLGEMDLEKVFVVLSRGMNQGIDAADGGCGTQREAWPRVKGMGKVNLVLRMPARESVVGSLTRGCWQAWQCRSPQFLFLQANSNGPSSESWERLQSEVWRIQRLKERRSERSKELRRISRARAAGVLGEIDLPAQRRTAAGLRVATMPLRADGTNPDSQGWQKYPGLWVLRLHHLSHASAGLKWDLLPGLK